MASVAALTATHPRRGSRQVAGFKALAASGSMGPSPTRRKSYLELLKLKEKRLQNPRDADQLFKMLLRKDKPEDIALECDKRLLPVLKDALAITAGNLTLPLQIVAQLGCEEKLSHGIYKTLVLDVFLAFYEAPGFMDAVRTELMHNRLPDPAAVAWMLIKLAPEAEEVRQCRGETGPAVRDIVDMLLCSTARGMGPLVPQLSTFFTSLKTSAEQGSVPGPSVADAGQHDFPESLQAAKRAMRPPGTRDHDNDPEDFRSVCIVPTPSELNCSEGPYLPPAEGSSFIADREAAMLDRQFRLVREDLVGALREELAEEMKGAPKGFRRIFQGPRLEGISTERHPCVLVSVPIPGRLLSRVRGMKEADAREFFHNGPGRRVLGQDTMVLLMSEGPKEVDAKDKRHSSVQAAGASGQSNSTAKLQTVAVGVVVMRRGAGWDILHGDRNRLTVGVSFVGKASLSVVTQMLNGGNGNLPAPSSCCLFSASVGFFTYEPVLRSLQLMGSIPLGGTLAYLEDPAPPGDLPHCGRAMEEFSDELQKAVEADKTQTEALKLLMSSSVVLVQGPPGTGKTYVGVQMVKAMLEAQETWGPGQGRKGLRILCLCYTNHALDSFMESLMDGGVPAEQFIRLGSSPKISERLRPRCLRELPESTFNNEERKGFAILKTERKELERELQDAQARLSNAAWGKGGAWWQTVESFLSDDYYEYCEQLVVPSAEDGMGFRTAIGIRGSGGAGPGYLWEQWCEGKGRGAFARGWVPPGDGVIDIWAMSKEERMQLKDRWNEEWKQPMNDKLSNLMQTMAQNTRSLEDLRLSNQSRVLKNATIIGCTTVGAAKMRGMLREVAPDVVLVEEAGELLEAQVISTISDKCKQLILIGDHMQLRPKTECYTLSKEAGAGLDLDVSLFERLVTHRDPASGKALPSVTLQVQHRMRPEVSNLVRRTMYPDLVDHPSTLGRPRVNGVARPVLFVTHNHPEMGDAESEVLGSHSKVNVHEAKMVCNLARHLLHQEGCQPDSITILTPYLGQLAEIRRRLLVDAKLGAMLSDQDTGDLARLDLLQGGGADQQQQAGTKCVRAATVDNFQGEESDIVLVSLVRSNPQGEIGFLSNAQRINVMLSRARNAMFIFGDLSCLTNSRSARGRDLWRRLQGLLEEKGQLARHVPLVCETHGVVAKAQDPADFDRLSPHGGCTLPCDGVLPCGHRCHLPCHPHQGLVHSKMVCSHLVSDVCEYGHKVQRKCGVLIKAKCLRIVTWNCPEGHQLSGPCHQGRSPSCSVCREMEQREAKAAASLQAQREEIRNQQGRLAKLKADLEAAELKKASQQELDLVMAEQRLVEERLASMELTTLKQASNAVRPPLIQLPRPAADEGPAGGAGSGGIAEDKTRDGRAKEIAPAVSSPHPPLVPDVPLGEAEPGKSKAATGSPGNDHPAAPQQPERPSDLASLDGDEDLLGLLEEYSSRGPLRADNLLDSVICSRNGMPILPSLEAMRFIIGCELDPSGSSVWHSGEAAPPKTLSRLSEAVCSWAAFLRLSQRFPLQARQHAEALVRFHEVSPSGPKLPPSWIEQATKALEPADFALPGSAGSVDGGSEGDNKASSRAAAQWEEVVERDPKAPKVMVQVLAMVGLEEVKGCMVSQYHRIKLAQRQGDSTASSYNARFDGNPGTGKTTVARHYNTFLQQLGVLPEGSLFVETSGASLIHKGVQHLESELDKIKDVGGGVVFVDEAYQLVSDRAGKQVLDFILPLAEGLASKYGRLVWLFAGYTKDMEKLFEHNPGLPSRFPLHFKFEDYRDDELAEIFKGLLQMKPPGAGSSSSSSKGGGKGRDATAPFIPPPSQNPYAYGGIPNNGQEKKDFLGNLWTWTGSSWYDKHRNATGYGPDWQFATSSNPLIDPYGNRWTFDARSKTWRSHTGAKQQHYPGDPAPAEARENPFHCREKDIRITIRRLGRGRGRPGFGNARAVRNLFDQVRARQASRIVEETRGGKEPDIFEFTQSDLLGPPATAARIRQTAAYKELHKLEGLRPVKEQVDQLIALVDANWAREQREEPVLDVVLNRVFLGNPGTGKTTVAAIYGRILGEMGLLSKGDVLMKTVSDFVGDVVGSSEKITREILKAAEGCVLVIDEAYSLYSAGRDGVGGFSDPYKTAVIDTLVEQVQARAGDDRAVVLLGYEEEMRTMMKHVNPGLQRRFQLEFNFPDYTDESLIRILMSKASGAGLGLGLDVAKHAVASLAKERAKPNFGNAGAVDNMLSEAKLRLQHRIGASGDKQQLTLGDFGIQLGQDDATLDSLFDDLVGCEEVRNKMRLLRDSVSFRQGRGMDLSGTVSYNWVFTGNPGTGKTTVARRMGRMFKALGLLPSNEVREISASDLITGYTGQAGRKTREVLQMSRGGVLFIDEAYQLNPRRGGSYMTEVVDELVKCLTSEEFKDKVLVILAGYQNDMEQMIATNPGLRSRFAERLHFADMAPEAAAEMAMSKLRQQLPVARCAEDGIGSVAKELAAIAEFSNGRDVDQWVQKVVQWVAKRTTENKIQPRDAEVTMTDLRCALQDMVESRATTRTPDAGGELSSQQEQQQMAVTVAPPAEPTVATATKNSSGEQDRDEDSEAAEDPVTDLEAAHPFGGVSGEVLQHLQQFLDTNGINTEEGMREVAQLSPSSPEFNELLDKLVRDLGMSPAEATDQLLKWQSAHKDLQRELQVQKEKSRASGQEPIWRCAVCGRADKPWIACWVAPYIVGYRPIGGG